ncbi:MAG: galactokinase [bacterium]|nr:galactokinase [bacterium]
MTTTCIETLLDEANLTDRLVECGLNALPAASKAHQFARAARTLLDDGISGDTAVGALYVPGRIEVLGKHTDYCAGHSLVAAAERGICFVVVPRDDAVIRALAVDLDDACEFALSSDITPAVGHWSNYPMTVARRVAQNFPGDLRGATIAYCGDLPPDAGMSSSSAVLTGSFLLISRVNNLESRSEYRDNIQGRESLAAYLGAVENGSDFGSLAGLSGVGTFGGSEDHTAILNAVPGSLRRYSYCPVKRHETLPLDDQYTFVIACSGVVAPKTGSALEKYNRMSRRAKVVLELWRTQTGRDDAYLSCAISNSPDSVDSFTGVLSGGSGDLTGAELLSRFEHFRAENYEIIPAACKALSCGNMSEFGRHVDRSQELADTLLGSQVPQTVFLARTAREIGAVAASSFGAGFGGAVWALARRDEADAFAEQWSARYAEAFPTESKGASFFTTDPGPAAFFACWFDD